MSNRECPFHHELLASYSTGNATLQERATVERHLAQCEFCRREVVELEKAWWSLDVWQDEVQHAPLRFNELKLRLANQPTAEKSWIQLLRNQISLIRLSWRMTPAAALAGIVGIL
ncbi:MAG: hypothetical protein C4527_17375, partial [Candidatus Omnitrophota bacterium]